MQIKGSIALVTGANRGLGRHFAAQLFDRGAAKVYATARNPSTVDLPGVVPVGLDITDPTSVARAAAEAPDVTLLINNAGISTHSRLSDGDMADIRREMDTHYFGTLETIRAFAPKLAANGGGAILNVLSLLAWAHFPDYGGYSAAKAAELALTNVVRQELAPSGIDVTALHVGYMDTDMASYVDPANKTDPAEVAAAALDGIERGDFEVVADEASRRVRAALSGGLELVYPQVFAAAGD